MRLLSSFLLDENQIQTFKNYLFLQCYGFMVDFFINTKFCKPILGCPLHYIPISQAICNTQIEKRDLQYSSIFSILVLIFIVPSESRLYEPQLLTLPFSTLAQVPNVGHTRFVLVLPQMNLAASMQQGMETLKNTKRVFKSVDPFSYLSRISDFYYLQDFLFQESRETLSRWHRKASRN